MDSLPDDARLRKLLADVAATPPYPGLRPFRPDEQRFFKGRKAQIEEVTARLTTEKCVVVHGGSGSGKSSLVRAGVIPALRLQSIPDRGDFWRAAICTPGQSPVGNLAAALDAVLSPAPTGGDRVGRVRDVLAGGDGLGGFMPAFRGEIPLEEGVSRTVLDKANLLVLVDQFEELFREENHGNPEAAWLAGLVVDAWRNRERYEGLYLVLTMRSEDLHRCAEFIELPNMINAAGYLTRRLEEKELREAIVAPVRPLLIRARLLASGGATGEADLRPFDVEVVTRLLDAAEEIAADPDHLPLLQHLLAVLWRTALRRWQDDGIGPNAEPGVEVRDLARAIGLESWEEAETARRTWETRQVDRGRDRLAGRGWLLRRGLENVAEALYRGLAAPDQRIARTSFCLMGVVDDRGSFKRRWTTLREIREVAAAPGLTLADPALKSFMAPDPFIRAEAEAKPEVERSLDVSHESLMRNWESLGDWLRRDREDGEAMLDVRRAYVEQGDRWPASWLAANAPKVLGWVSPLRGHRLARARELPDRGYSPAWTERFKASEEDRPAVTEPGDGPTGAEPPFGALMAYVRGSKMRHTYRTQTRVLLCALGVCIVLAGLGAYALAVNWREAGKFSKLEARAFNAYSLADANDLPRYAGLPYERQIHGVHELALVHQALMTMKEPDSLTGRLLYRGRQMARERMAVSSRLADQLADRTSRGVLAAALWPVARTRAPVATPATDGACTPGRRITDFNNRDKIFSLIGAPADLPGLPGAAPGTKVQAGLLRSWREARRSSVCSRSATAGAGRRRCSG
jgi:hypothetical protein